MADLTHSSAISYLRKVQTPSQLSTNTGIEAKSEIVCYLMLCSVTGQLSVYCSAIRQQLTAVRGPIRSLVLVAAFPILSTRLML